ncbi:hypothetical protein GXW71_30195 [Roseomonas hellenica]|uniref:Uncharacterized protein n=1 Tax=Plastoroseomonas hellenica TaxID=2687306 RepID=A0ABS5F7X1_9PROT|nr:hypothetical protein [Plastoroseomonas hellenica]MBR0668661.1 hypothetical protein [Plastoroseomonas hellenica]
MAAQLGRRPVAPLPLPAGSRRESESSRSPGHRWDAVLARMVEKGLGLEAISTVLGLSSGQVLDRAVALSLPTPSAAPMRRRSHPRAWAIADMRLMVECWLDRWDAGSIATLFERSRGSIYALKRRLNLPGRARSDIKRPAAEKLHRRQRMRDAARGVPPAEGPPRTTERPASPSLALPLGPSIAPAIVLVTSPPPPLVALQRALIGEPLQLAPSPLAPATEGGVTTGLVQQADGSILRVEKRAGRDETLWTLLLDLNLSYRVFAGQHYKAIASDLGLSAAAVRTRSTRLGLPKVPRDELVHRFDPCRVIERIRSSGYVLKRCGFLTGFYFWSARDEDRRRSPCARKSRSFKRAQVAPDAAYAL